MDVKNYVKRNVLAFKTQVLDPAYATKNDLANVTVSDEVIAQKIQDNLGENVVTTEEVPLEGEYVSIQPVDTKSGFYNETGYHPSSKITAYIFNVNEGDKIKLTTTVGYYAYNYVLLDNSEAVISLGTSYPDKLFSETIVVTIPSGVTKIVVMNSDPSKYTTEVFKYSSAVGKTLKINGNDIHSSVLKNFTVAFSEENMLTPSETITGKVANRSGSFADAQATDMKKYLLTKGQRIFIRGCYNEYSALYHLRYVSDDSLYSFYPNVSGTEIVIRYSETIIDVPIDGLYLLTNDNANYTAKVYDISDGKGQIIPNTTRFNGNVLYGKKWAVCGDSFTAGDSLDKDPVTHEAKTYDFYIRNRNNMDTYKLAVAGNDFTNVEGAVRPFSNPNTTRYNYTQIPTDCDYVTIQFGLNESDFTATEIGSKTDSDNTTLWGAYNVVLDDILTKNPTVKIGIIISDAWTPKAYHDALVEIAQYWGIPYLDLKNGSSLLIGGRWTGEDINPRAVELRNEGFKVSASNSHPSADGHEYRSTIIENFLRSL